MQGFIGLHRKLMDNVVWSDPNYLKLWIYCLFKASHKDHEQLVGNQTILLKRGQFVTGRKSLSADMNKEVKPAQQLSEKSWERYLKNLEKWQMLTINVTNKYSVVTIANYGVYQSPLKKDDQQNDQQLTSKSPADDQQLTTNKNVNNGFNVENDKNNKVVVASATNFYEQNFGVLSPYMQEDINLWVDDLSEELVIEALKLTKENNKQWKYTKGILKDWYSKNLKTIEQVQASQIEYAANKQNSTYKGKPTREEIKPDWFGKEQDKPQEPENDPDLEERKRAIEERLKNLKQKEG